MKKIYFVSSNRRKYNEIEPLGIADGIEIEHFDKNIPELQTAEERDLINEKIIKAFEELRRPVLVEHTVLSLKAFEGMPGAQTSYFYSKLKNEKIVDYCRYRGEYKAYVKSIFGFTDGKNFYTGEQQIDGTIVDSVEKIKGIEGFDWDVIFIPDNDNPEKKTFAQLGSKKWMREAAWANLKNKYRIDWISLLDDKEDKQLEEEHKKKLAELIKKGKVMLFIGAGISASINPEKKEEKSSENKEPMFPSWNELIGELGKSAGYDKRLFSTYGDNMMLAEYIVGKDEKFVYGKLNEMLEVKDEVRERLCSSEIYKAIVDLDVPVIYTTNYDHLLEEAFKCHNKPFSTVATIEDMQTLDENGLRIMKFHGDIGKEDAVVLSESQYYERMNFQSCLDIQLQADMMKYSILFLGYSMSDINIKLLLYLAKKRRTGTENGLKAYIYTATPNEIQREIFKEKDIITISGDKADKKEGTKDFLVELADLAGKSKNGQKKQSELG